MLVYMSVCVWAGGLNIVGNKSGEMYTMRMRGEQEGPSVRPNDRMLAYLCEAYICSSWIFSYQKKE